LTLPSAVNVNDSKITDQQTIINEFKGVSNPNFRLLSFELKKFRFFKNKFWSRFQSSVTLNTEEI